MEQAPSSGKSAAIAIFGTGKAIILVMWLSAILHIPKMDVTIADAIVSGIGALIAFKMHTAQRKKENETPVVLNGTSGGPDGLRDSSAAAGPNIGAGQSGS